MILERSERRQREVGDDLYKDYHDNRVRLIQYLTGPAHAKPLDVAIRMAQKLVDRIIFLAFCEDRELLPARSLFRAWSQVPAFYQVTNPRWENFLSLFRNVDEGSLSGDVPRYGAGLFKVDEDVDNLALDDSWTDSFKSLGDYDFASEVTADVLTQVFERSVDDIEQMRAAGGLSGRRHVRSALPKKAERAEGAVQEMVAEELTALEAKHGIDLKCPEEYRHDGKLKRCIEDVLAALRALRVVDPRCGSGAFLAQAYEVLEEFYFNLTQALEHVDPISADKMREQMPDFILRENLFGADTLPEAVEITQLSLWLRSARRGRPLTDLSRNIVCTNSLMADPQKGPRVLPRGTGTPWS